MKTKMQIELSPWVMEELQARSRVCHLPVRAVAEQIIESQLADDRKERREAAMRMSEQSDKRQVHGRTA